jgi:hypothetical protein
MSGRSFADLIKSEQSGQIDPTRDHALLGRERHDVGRANEGGFDLSYPVRAIRTKDYLYVHNLNPERWPVGNPEFGLRDTDGSPTKEVIVNIEKQTPGNPFYQLNFGMRPEEEFYVSERDPHCIDNQASNPEYETIKTKLRAQMETELTLQQDPRMLGTGDVFDITPYLGKPYDYEKKKYQQ